jgi:LuxR family maltose regulon positive regulatory protein
MTDQTQKQLQGEIDMLRSQISYWRGEGQRCLALARRSLAVTPAEHTRTRGLALVYAAGGLQQTGNIAAALDLLRDGLQDTNLLSSTTTLQLLFGQLTIEFLAGDLKSVTRTATHLLDMPQEQAGPTSGAWKHYYLGRTELEQNNPVKAQTQFTAVLEQRYVTHARIVQDSFYGMALAHQMLGQSAEAGEFADAASAYAVEVRNTRSMLEARSFQARLALLQGRPELAGQWAQEIPREIALFPALFIEIPQATQVKAMLSQKTPDHLHQAEMVLNRLQHFVTNTNTPWAMIEIMALQALLNNAQGNREQALTALEQAVSLARPGGFIRVFVELGPQIASMLQQLTNRGKASDFTEQILAAFPGSLWKDKITADHEAPIQNLAEPLTQREMEILRLLSERLTHKEIARKLVISPLTVRKHTSNIYQKLGVQKRAAAVATAEHLGILRPR